ncbi:MAG TPA: MarR family transcriptional regulator [Rhizobacter sp.]|jgi:DNA-binding MarR family transcriptional regulator|nr:MarR family transcriptional regulator [Rhizobacter sp.]
MSRPLPPADFYRPNEYTADESVGYLLRRLLYSMKQETDKRLEPHGLTNAQWEPLYKLRKCMASTVAELAREMQTDPGATTRLLDRLEAKGLCKRIRSTEDRRVVNLELTPEGEAVADKVPGALATVMNAHLAGFSKTEWQALTGYLRRMVANGEEMRDTT